MNGFTFTLDRSGLEVWFRQVSFIDDKPVFIVINEHLGKQWSWKVTTDERRLFGSAFSGDSDGFFKTKELAFDDLCARLRLVGQLWEMIRDEDWIYR